LRHALPLVLLVAVALAYEADPHVPAMRLDGWGAVVAAIVVAAALVWRLGPGFSARGGHRRRSGTLRAGAGLLVFVVFVGAALVVTVAPEAPHRPLPNVAVEPDSSPAWAKALGGSDTELVDAYQVTSELPGFVGHAAYPGEQLLTWWPHAETGELMGPIGMFHSGYDAVSVVSYPILLPGARAKIEYRRPAQILLMSTTGDGFSTALGQLRRAHAHFDPDVVRRGVLSDGTFDLHVWLIDLDKYFHRVSR
jgi:hypothetical protein